MKIMLMINKNKSQNLKLDSCLLEIKNDFEWMLRKIA